MSKIGVSFNINVSEIEKGRLFQGKKGKYLSMTVFIDLDKADEYGNHGMVTQDVNKEERDNGIKGAILGNCKIFWRGDGSGNQQAIQQGQQVKQQAQQAKQETQQQMNDDFDDDIPF